jgi:Uma2 family endonuclease
MIGDVEAAMATTQVTVPRRTRESLVIPDTDWRTYCRLAQVFAERRGVRLAYDRGWLEIMSPSVEHDSGSRLLGRFVTTLTEELGRQILSGGATTLRRRLEKRGLEPDECFWIQNEAAVRGVRRLNLRLHPPPDLTIEIDVTNSSLDRMSIYAALGVPEVWRLDGDVLSFHVLGVRRRYTQQNASRAFPQVTPADLQNFLSLRYQQEENAIVRQFRAWVRQLPPAAPAKP